MTLTTHAETRWLNRSRVNTLPFGRDVTFDIARRLRGAAHGQSTSDVALSMARGVSHFYHKGNAFLYKVYTHTTCQGRRWFGPRPRLGRPENTVARGRALARSLTRRRWSRGAAASFSSHRRGLASFRGRTKNRGSLVRDGKSPASAKGRNRERRSRWGVSGTSKLD